MATDYDRTILPERLLLHRENTLGMNRMQLGLEVPVTRRSGTDRDLPGDLFTESGAIKLSCSQNYLKVYVPT